MISSVVLTLNVSNVSDPSRLQYPLATSSRVEIAVHDVRGRHVGTVVNGPVAPGAHDAEWESLGFDGHAVPDGVYFITLFVNNCKVAARRWVKLR